MLYMHEDIVDLFIAGGDFNGRLRNRDDFILDVDNIFKRKNINDVFNKHGEALLEFLIGNKLCVLKGRLPGDDNFTFIKPQGKSAVDYFITQIDSMKYSKICMYYQFMIY